MHQRINDTCQTNQTKEERNFCEPLSLIKTQRKGERRAKISPTNFNRLIIVIIEHNFDEAKKKEKDLHAKSLFLYECFLRIILSLIIVRRDKNLIRTKNTRVI